MNPWWFVWKWIEQEYQISQTLFQHYQKNRLYICDVHIQSIRNFRVTLYTYNKIVLSDKTIICFINCFINIYVHINHNDSRIFFFFLKWNPYTFSIIPLMYIYFNIYQYSFEDWFHEDGKRSSIEKINCSTYKESCFAYINFY